MQEKHIDQMVTITRQGQVTIPQSLRKKFRIKGSTKARITSEQGKIIITPKVAFASLGGSLKSSVKLSDRQLRQARTHFAKEFGRKI
ncbi:MAG: AbrB/MazE/SpoVT family DNA-binding domain-containing protein [Patescibacteria group bacterium]